MSGQHTSGPWEVGQDDKNGQAVVRSKHIEVATCWHHCVGSIEKEMRANARLIAAAPDLLAALQTMVDGYIECFGDEADDAPEPVKQARAAIAKATGAAS